MSASKLNVFKRNKTKYKKFTLEEEKEFLRKVNEINCEALKHVEYRIDSLKEQEEEDGLDTWDNASWDVYHELNDYFIQIKETLRDYFEPRLKI